MSGRFTTKITNSKHKSYNNMSDTAVAILGAGVGSRIKSHEPRSLIKIGDKTLIEHQVSMIRNSFENPEIIGVVGCKAEKVIKKNERRNQTCREPSSQYYKQLGEYQARI